MMKPGCSPLLLSGHLLLCLTAISVLATPDVPAGQRPGCLAKCGNVDIPFPFGVGDHCALNPNFTFNCNKTMDGSMKLFKWNLEVTEISVPDGKAWVIAPTISWRCYYYASTRSMVKSDGWLNVTNSPFWISEVDNKIIVIGCHTLAYMRSFSYVIGCYSTCSNGNLKNGICSGAGCCQADVPEGVRYYSGNFDEAYNTTSKDRPCSYMVLMQKDAFRLNTSYVDSTVFYEAYNGSVPVVLNWEIQQLTCEVARQNMSSYACMSSNSECLNSTNEQGYRCRCSHGYQGNPYIKDGCTDIDECHENDNPCGLEICQNTLGNYNCSCRLGYYKTDGVCVPNPSRFRPMPVIGASIGFVVLVILVACASLIRERRKLENMKQKYFRQHGGVILFNEMKSKEGNAFKIFREEELQQATDNFSEKKVVGRGGHGTVYRGLLKGNVEVAVKKCKTIDDQQKKEFGKEMVILSQINHKNIVKLLGCCLEWYALP